jgi:L-alanine-DL-glutamate epimerase-like enolase superfamily enzyme
MPSARIVRLELEPLRIPFKTAFRHASAERVETSSLWTRASLENGVVGCGESCPRPYVTNESLDTAQAFFERHEQAWRECIFDVASLGAWMASNTPEIDKSPAAWCAVELAVLDALAKNGGKTVERLLARPELEGTCLYTAVLGDADPGAFEATADQYRRFGFSDFKVKLSGNRDRDRAKLSLLRGFGTKSIRLRVDANNLWNTADEAIQFLRSLDYPFFAIEEPLRANQYERLARISDTLACPIVLDESLLRVEQLQMLAPPSKRWIVNVRVSKMGGLVRSIAIVEAARRLGLRIIVGAQVGETSLLTRAALTVARAAGDALVAQEGAFGTKLLAHDICDPPLMFGQGGILNLAAFPALQQPGFGIV